MLEGIATSRPLAVEQGWNFGSEIECRPVGKAGHDGIDELIELSLASGLACFVLCREDPFYARFWRWICHVSIYSFCYPKLAVYLMNPNNYMQSST